MGLFDGNGVDMICIILCVMFCVLVVLGILGDFDNCDVVMVVGVDGFLIKFIESFVIF